MIVQFGDYLPDLPDFQNPGATVANNVLPGMKSYKPFPSLDVYSNALDTRCRGAIAARDKGAINYHFAGDATKLYNLTGTASAASTYTDFSRTAVYTTADTDNWEFTKFGEHVIATNYADAMQRVTLGGSQFLDITSTDVTALPKARHIGIVKEFVVLGNTDYNSVEAPNRVQWSGLDNLTTYSAAAATQAGLQDLADGGDINKVVGGENGLIFQENAVTLMSYVNVPDIFHFDQIESGRGTRVPGSVIKTGSMVFYLAKDGFYAMENYRSTPIGAEKVNRTFISDFNETYSYRVNSIVDTVNHVVMWAYPSIASVGPPDKVIAFNWYTGKWAVADLAIEAFTDFYSVGFTLLQLSNLYGGGVISDVIETFGDGKWKGGIYQLAAFDTAHKLSTLTGTALTATLETTEFQANPNGRSFVTGLRPLVEGGSATCAIAGRTRPADAATYSTAVALNADGECPVRSDGRYHRAKVTIVGGFDNAQGVDVTARRSGKR